MRRLVEEGYKETRRAPTPNLVLHPEPNIPRIWQEVCLLGQNVNSYADLTTPPGTFLPGTLPERPLGGYMAEGFEAKYKYKDGALRCRDPGLKPCPHPHLAFRFTELLARLSEVAPEMRFRFTSPHPKALIHP